MPPHEEGPGALWRKEVPEPSHAELLCSQGYVLCAHALSILHLVVSQTHSFLQHSFPTFASYVVTVMWHDSSLILSGTGSIFLLHANLLKCSTFSAVCVLISVLQPAPPPVLLF